MNAKALVQVRGKVMGYLCSNISNQLKKKKKIKLNKLARDEVDLKSCSNGNCKDKICFTAQMNGQWPNKSKTMNLLESRLETKLLMS